MHFLSHSKFGLIFIVKVVNILEVYLYVLILPTFFVP